MIKREKYEYCSIMNPFNKENALIIAERQHSVQEYIDHIKLKKIDQAWVIMPNIKFLIECPSLKYLRITPTSSAEGKFCFSPLYEMNSLNFLNCENIYGDQEEYCAEIDFSRLQNLKFLSVTYNKGIHNLTNLVNLKTLVIWNYQSNEKNLKGLIGSEVLDTLELNSSKIQSLDGIGQSERMQCIYLNYNRSLKDISALKNVKNTLKALHIQNCSKIEDFSVLSELENLEYLSLEGSNSIPNLKFINDLKKLKTFIFNVNILDGDLSPCLRLDYVYSEKNRKHYNFKDDDLPKGYYVCGNENIEKWRQLE